MRKTIFSAALLAGTAIAASPASAQNDAAALASEIGAMRAKIESLEAKVKELESNPGKGAAAVPSWKGAPQFEDKSKGWSFKPLGRLQYDAGYVSRPAGITDPGLGFSNEVRRARLGVEGTVPGGFGYKLELEFADNDVEITDAILSYQASKTIGITIGQHNAFQSMEELTSSRFLSFMERAAFTDAFNFERRVGLSTTIASGAMIAQAGIFTDNVEDLGTIGDDNNAVSVDGRLVFAPRLGKQQLHLGASAHYRDNEDVGILTRTRYRQRPFIHSSDVRFIGTSNLDVDRETSYGLEGGFISGPFHAAAEAHWLNADLRTGATPTFFGGYVEGGWFITGETRGYKGGRWDRTKVLKPVGGGGFGALQLNLRYDHLDLNSDGILGGRQRGYEASLIWIPQDHIRFLINYGHLGYQDAAIAAAGGDRRYSVDVVGARAQVDF